ncbi:MAG: S-formylglutathione hydrolase [Rhodospirillaceae bacterium]|nr:S-formylglutathione hydrolase [Rhodospirillaceae bacterium]|tara:strand:+ start:811 stop:1653 length:843 start_codon:yes stop_codon:yes gene_type:complete
MNNNLQLISESKNFNGTQHTFEHESITCNCTMRFAVFLPEVSHQSKVPVLFWLSGLTCSEENFIVKSGAQRIAAQLGLALVVPDTSPRNLNLPGEEEHMEIGTGASFYVNATQQPWAPHYRMFDYVTKELVETIDAHLPIDINRKSISGHSMGGHGALMVGLKEPDKYASVSAFSPICSASKSKWGSTALKHYLGPDKEIWRQHDVSALIRKNPCHHEFLIDQGDADPFLEELRPNDLKAACVASGQKLTYRERAGYDHSYFFVSTYIEEHLRFHYVALS